MWLGFNIFVIILLALDLGILHRKDKDVGVREALLLSLGYFIVAVIFGAGVFHFLGEAAGYEFFTGYLIEKTLSLDNIFVFVLIFNFFAVPRQYQHRVLFWGIIGALLMRGTFILVGAAVIQAFHWILYIFGAFLILTGIKMLITINVKPDMQNNSIVKFLRKRLRVTESFVDNKFFVRKDGLLFITPLMLVLILVEVTDVIFALDSIPAIFAITTDPFIVYTSNVFAILGLRALYFALAGIIHRFHYLKYGLSFVLMVVGAKMLLNSIFGAKVISTELALAITAALIGGSIAYSVFKTRYLPKETGADIALHGWVPGGKKSDASINNATGGSKKDSAGPG